MGIEKEAERVLIAEINKSGYYAAHVDCTIDGFPDIVMFGRFGSRLIEMKYGPVSTSLGKAFEPTQPVHQKRLENAGYYEFYTCLWDGRMYRLYDFKGLLKMLISAKEAIRFKDFAPIASGGPERIIEYLTKEIRI